MRNAYLVWSTAAFRGPRSVLAPAWRHQGAGAAARGAEALAAGAAHWQPCSARQAQWQRPGTEPPTFRAARTRTALAFRAGTPWHRHGGVTRRRSGRPMEEAAARRHGEEGRRGTGAERKEAARPADRVTGGTRSRSESE